MPHHYPKDQSEENLKKIRRNNVCEKCGRNVVEYLDLKTHKVYIACSGQVHEGITREYQAPIEDYESNIRREIELEEQHGRGASTALAQIPKQGQLTEIQAQKVLNLVYPKATHDEITRCAIFCQDFGLHPLANEVFLIPFKGKNVMVVGIAANRKMAHALKGDFSFLENTPRAAKEEEIIEQYGKDSEEAEKNIISVTKLQGVGGNKAIGFGLYSKKESPYGMDKGNTRRNMANIRSERQAIDRLPGRVMPVVEVIDAKYTVLPDVGKVNTDTGEIVKAEFTEAPPEAELGEDATPEEVEAEKRRRTEPPPTGRIDMPWLIDSVNTLKWDILQYIKDTYKVEASGNLGNVVDRLSDEQIKELSEAVQSRLDLR